MSDADARVIADPGKWVAVEPLAKVPVPVLLAPILAEVRRRALEEAAALAKQYVDDCRDTFEPWQSRDLGANTADMIRALAAQPQEAVDGR